MRYFLSLLLLISAAGELCSQMQLGVFGGINFYPSEGFNRLMIGKDGSSFDRFASSYNTYNASQLSAPLGSFNMIPGLSAGMNFNKGFYYSEVAYNSLHGRTDATFLNGNKRVFEMKSHDLEIGMGFGYSSSKIFIYLCGFMDFGFGDKLESWIEFKDGTVSMGNENYLNGRYEAGRLSLRPGLRVGYSVNQKVSLLFMLDKMKEGGEHDEYMDELAGDIETEIVNSDLEFIGEDWGSYVSDPSGYILSDGALVKSGWSGLQCRVVVSFTLMNKGGEE